MTVNLARNGDVSVAYETAGPAEGAPLLLINGMGRQQLLHWPPGFVDALVGQGFRVAQQTTEMSGFRRTCPRSSRRASAESCCARGWLLTDAMTWPTIPWL